MGQGMVLDAWGPAGSIIRDEEHDDLEWARLSLGRRGAGQGDAMPRSRPSLYPWAEQIEPL